VKQVKINKQKVWRKTYGKPFIARKAICIAQMAVSTAVAVSQINIFGSAHAALALKAAKAAECIVNLSKAISDQSSDINKGFINREQANKKD
jgi:hypothetical protein